MDYGSDPLAIETGRGMNRRTFVKSAGASALATAVPVSRPWPGSPAVSTGATAASPALSVQTAAAARLYRTLTPVQRSRLCFPFQNPLRLRLQNHWAIVEPRIGDLTGQQQALCREIFRNLCTEDGFERLQRQMKDDYGGFDRYHVALFGEPGSGEPFEWVVTGRHLTLRADGNTATGMALRGPIFYGHGADTSGRAGTRTDNVWWHQAIQANKIFASLDSKQRSRMLARTAGPASADDGRCAGTALEPGLRVADLDVGQKSLLQELLRDLSGSFRLFDFPGLDEHLDGPASSGTFRLSLFEDDNHGNGRICAIWKLEGPAFSWYFHGLPHVHAWIITPPRV